MTDPLSHLKGFQLMHLIRRKVCDFLECPPEQHQVQDYMRGLGLRMVKWTNGQLIVQEATDADN